MSSIRLILLLFVASLASAKPKIGTVADNSTRVDFGGGGDKVKAPVPSKINPSGCRSKNDDDEDDDTGPRSTEAVRTTVTVPASDPRRLMSSPSPLSLLPPLRCQPQLISTNFTDETTGCSGEIAINMCAGMCESFSDLTNSAMSFCSCCQAYEYEKQEVFLRCPGRDGTRKKKIRVAKACACLTCRHFNKRGRRSTT